MNGASPPWRRPVRTRSRSPTGTRPPARNGSRCRTFSTSRSGRSARRSWTGPASRRASACSTSAAAPARRPSSSPAASARPGASPASTSPRRCSARARERASAAGLRQRRPSSGRRRADAHASSRARFDVVLLALRRHVLRRPGRRVHQPARGAASGRPARLRLLAGAAGQPVDGVPLRRRRAAHHAAAAAEPGAPGPFAFADPARVRGILEGAGFGDVTLADHRTTLTVGGGKGLDEVTDFLLTGDGADRRARCARPTPRLGQRWRRRCARRSPRITRRRRAAHGRRGLAGDRRPTRERRSDLHVAVAALRCRPWVPDRGAHRPQSRRSRWSGPEVGNGGRYSGGGAWARLVLSPEERR